MVERGRRRAPVQAIKLALALALLVWITTSGRFDWSGLARLRDPRSVFLLAGSGALVVASQLVTALRWRWVAGALGLELPFTKAFVVNYVGLLFNTFVLGGQGGDLIRVGLVLRAYPERRADATTSLIFDRVLGLLGLCLAALLATGLAWPILPTAARRGGLVVGIGATAAFAMGIAVLVLPVPALLRRVPLLPRLRDPLIVFCTRMGTLARNPSACVVGIALALVVHAMSLLAVAACACAVQVTIVGGAPLASLRAGAWGTTFTMLLNVVPITPGNLGVTEAISGELFRLLGSAGGASLFAIYRVVCALACLPALVPFLSERAKVSPLLESPSHATGPDGD